MYALLVGSYKSTYLNRQSYKHKDIRITIHSMLHLQILHKLSQISPFFFYCYNNYFLFPFSWIRSSQPSAARHFTCDWCCILLMSVDRSSIHHSISKITGGQWDLFLTSIIISGQIKSMLIRILKCFCNGNFSKLISHMMLLTYACYS